jgi:hypothetical protein
MTNVNGGNFNFTFSTNHKAELEAYINDIITVTRAQVQAKMDHTKLLLSISINPSESAEERAKELADEAFVNTLANRQLRIQIIENLTDCYFEATDASPDAKQLERLADAILCEELTDPNPHKISQEEFPFLSEVQAERRQFGRRGSQASNTQGERVTDLSGMKDEDSNGKYHNSPADHLDSDGKSRRKPIRRTRGTNEALLFESKVRSKNRERRKKYQEFTKVQPVKRWNMYTGEVFE